MDQEIDKKTLAIVLATIAGYLMISSGMFFAIANTGIINNNNIGIENAKFKIINNQSLQQDPELNQLVIYNNLLAKKYSDLTLFFFGVSIFLGLISVLLLFPKKAKLKK